MSVKTKTLKFRVYPTKRQKREIFRQLNNHRDLYNFCLNERIDTYKLTKKSPSCFDQIKANVPKFKNSCNVSSLQQTVRRLDKSFQNFFRRVKHGDTPGFPRFKKSFSSIEFIPTDGASLKTTTNGKQHVYIQHVGNLKLIKHREILDHSRITLKYNLGQFFVCFTVEYTPPVVKQKNGSVGIDFGLKNFITTSEGNVIHSPKFLKRSLIKLKKATSKRDKAEKGTSERKKKGIVVRNIYRKLLNQRSDFNHKLSCTLVRNYGTICLENIDLLGLKSDIKNVNRTYDDVSWGQFTQMLNYKAESAGCQIIYVDPSYTSQTCSKCGTVREDKLELTNRTFSCLCGYKDDRDKNAARNILGLGLRSLIPESPRLGLQSVPVLS